MTTTFRRFAGCTAIASAAASLLFTFAFTVVVQDGARWAQWLSWTTLSLGALASVPVLTALYNRLGRSEPEFALVGFVLGVAGAVGAAIHGAFELSELANPSGPRGDVPSGVDPRGVMTFAVTGFALALFGWLAIRTGGLPRRAGQWAIAAGVLLVVVYLGRLTVQDPKTNVIRVAALLSGLVLVPAFYLEVARSLFDRRAVAAVEVTA